LDSRGVASKAAKGSFQKPEVKVDDTVHKVLTGFSRRVHGLAESRTEHKREAICPLDRTLPADDVSDSNDSIIQSSTDYNLRKWFPSMERTVFECGFCLR